MRVMARVSIPVGAGNKGIRDGSLPKVMQQTAERWKPEARLTSQPSMEGARPSSFSTCPSAPRPSPHLPSHFFRSSTLKCKSRRS